MKDENSLLNLGNLMEPAKVLIEKISDAIGCVYKPRHIIHIAKAEAEAEKIKALGQIEISEIQQRSLKRLIHAEGIKQKNIEQITEKALNDLKEDANPNEMENDWIANFFDKCSMVSDKEMQSLWARILAGEANKLGTYSKRTVNNISFLDKKEANLFTSLCRFSWEIGNMTPLIYDLDNEIYSKNGITFTTLKHLDSIGLISFDQLAGYIKKSLPQKFQVTYYGTSVVISLPESAKGKMTIGNVLLTQIGQELVSLCGSTPIDGFIDYVIEYWKKNNYIV